MFSRINKYFKIFKKIVTSVLLLFLLLVLVFSVPSVQTSLGGYTTSSINKTYGTRIKIEKVGLQFNGDVELKNILINKINNERYSFKN